MKSLEHNLKIIPRTTGVYLMHDDKGEIIYIGKARNLSKRVHWYFRDSANHSLKTGKLKEKIKRINYIETISEFDALLLEAALIRKYKPKFNVIWRDDKRPLYIKITIKDEFPKVTTSRREDDKNSLYFGPFPSGRTVKEILRTLRRVFPYCNQKTNKRRCFYSHLGLCNPCPSEVKKLPPSQFSKEKRRYRQSVQRLINVLSGKTGSLIDKLERKMEKSINQQFYEKAAKLHDQINRLENLRQRHFSHLDYLSNPNLTEDVQRKETEELTMRLKKIAASCNLPFTIPDKIRRIECIDISNIAGTNATGSLVVFFDGKVRPNLYRKFKIRHQQDYSDTAMIREVVDRRFNHPEWSFPDLLLVDGGAGQVNAAFEVLRSKKIYCPVIGLAKRWEEIIFPLSSKGFKNLRLPQDSNSLHLLQRLRDEAHRFAKKYHRFLRKKSLIGDM